VKGATGAEFVMICISLVNIVVRFNGLQCRITILIFSIPKIVIKYQALDPLLFLTLGLLLVCKMSSVLPNQI
jgi:hypothetical protein